MNKKYIHTPSSMYQINPKQKTPKTSANYTLECFDSEQHFYWDVNYRILKNDTLQFIFVHSNDKRIYILILQVNFT